MNGVEYRGKGPQKFVDQASEACMSKGPIVFRAERSMKNRASSVADLHHFDADPDADPDFFLCGSGSDFSLGADPDPAFSCESVSDPSGT
jgi:hypothetical protein